MQEIGARVEYIAVEYAAAIRVIEVNSQSLTPSKPWEAKHKDSRQIEPQKEAVFDWRQSNLL